MVDGIPAVEVDLAEPHEEVAVRRLEPMATVTERTYWELRRALLNRAIRPGERLLEAKLAQQLGVSRTPVREALARLAAEGLADQLPGSRGVIVRDIGQELDDIYGLRQVLEGYAARLAATRITAEELNAIEELYNHIGARIEGAEENEAELQAHAELTNSFHLRIAAASRSPRLVHLISDYRDYFLSSDFLRLYNRGDMRKLQAQHAAIIAALRARDGTLAERLVREHFADAAAIIRSHAERTGRRVGDAAPKAAAGPPIGNARAMSGKP